MHGPSGPVLMEEKTVPYVPCANLPAPAPTAVAFQAELLTAPLTRILLTSILILQPIQRSTNTNTVFDTIGIILLTCI